MATLLVASRIDAVRKLVEAYCQQGWDTYMAGLLPDAVYDEPSPRAGSPAANRSFTA